MLRRFLVLGFVASMILGGAMACSLLRAPEEASGPIEAIPLSGNIETPAEPTQTAPPEVDTSPTTEIAAPYPAATEPAEAQETGGDLPQTTSFQIVQAGSQARFFIDEVLNNELNTVIGVTDQVAGEIAVDFNNPLNTQVGVIRVNARTLTTDNSFRNRALANRILTTDQFEFITFTPTEILGLPETVNLGESIAFQIAGDLTIRDVTRAVTFDVTVTPVSETELRGLAVTTVLYPDFALSIPQVPSVASVEDEVRLELEFTAAAG